MEPISILSLVGTCLTVGTKAFDVSRGLHDIITALSNSDKDIARLSNQVNLFSCAITQLRAWLAQDPSLSLHLRETLSQSLEHAIIVFLDIEKYVIQVIPKPGEATVGFRRRVRHLWNENAIKEHERMINTQFQAFNLLASLAQLNGSRDRDRVVQSSNSVQVFARGAEDARSIIASEDAASGSGRSGTDRGENLDVRLSIDTEIARSGPYVDHYRQLMRQQFNSRNPVRIAEGSQGSFQKPGPTRNNPPASSRSMGMTATAQGQTAELRHPQTGLPILENWETRMSESLCKAASEANLDLIKRLIAQGANVNGVSKQGFTPLGIAIEYYDEGYKDTVRYLMDHGASLDGLYRTTSLKEPERLLGHITGNYGWMSKSYWEKTNK